MRFSRFSRRSLLSGFCWLVAGGALALVPGCGSPTPTASTSNSSAPSTDANATTSVAPAVGAASTLTIISPHGREIQVEFERLWNASHPYVKLKWIDQGGTSDDLKFVREQFATRGRDKGIGIDLFFGGGGETFAELESDHLLAPLASDYGVPQTLNGVPLRAKDNAWIAAALSGFGILYNKTIAKRDGLPVPTTWADLANPKLRDRIELADPRHSGSAHTIYEIILQTNGWDKGWKILTAMAGNAHTFATSSSAPLTDVQNGEAVFCTAIDFYASRAINQAGAGKLAYIQPKGQYIVTPDPIALLPAAPNSENARAFVDLVLSPAGQKLWFFKKGAPAGPQENELSRLPALPSVYKEAGKNAFDPFNPYSQKTTAPYDSDKAAARRRALDDLIGAVLVDNLDSLQSYWKKNPNFESAGYVPLSEAKFNEIARKWDDPTVTDPIKQGWSTDARAKFNGS